MSERKIRVAHVLETVHMGGVEQRVRLLLQNLPRDRYDHLVICTQALGEIPNDISALGIPIVETGIFRWRIDPRAILRAYRAIRNFRPDIVHSAVFEGIIMGVVAGRLARVPVVLSEETAHPRGRRRSGHAFAKILYKMSDQVIAVSEFVHRYLVNDLKLPPSHVTLVPNAVRSTTEVANTTASAMRSALGYDNNDVVFAFVGRLDDECKGISDAIRAIAHNANDNARLLVVGDGPDRAKLEELARHMSVADQVQFVGYQGDPRPMLGAADALVHPARYEAFGLALAEAMFADLPIVATRVGGIPFVVKEDETGMLVEPNNVAALAAAMARLASDPALRSKMGAAGRARAEAEFSAPVYLHRIECLYRDCLGGDR